MSRFKLAGIAVALLVAIPVIAACEREPRADSDAWDIKGPLLAWDAGIWIVDAVPISVSDDVAANASLFLGATVTASGTFDDTGRRVAETVSLDAGPLPESTRPGVMLAGAIEFIGSNLWVVDGYEVVVASGTQIRTTEPGVDATPLIQIGSIAEVSGNQLSDARVVATDIVLHPATGDEQSVPVDQSETDPSTEPEPTPPPPDDTESDSGNGDDGEKVDGGDDDENGDDESDNHDKKHKREKPTKPDKDDARDKKD